MCNEAQTDWDEKLDTVLMGYRASRQDSTNHSPYFMLFQQQMRLPIDAEYLPPQEMEDSFEDVIDDLIASRKRVFGDAKKNLTSAQTKQKESYDLKHQPVLFSVGSQVLLENTAQKNRKGGKLEPAWLRPYTVNKYVGKGL